MTDIEGFNLINLWTLGSIYQNPFLLSSLGENGSRVVVNVGLSPGRKRLRHWGPERCLKDSRVGSKQNVKRRRRVREKVFHF